MKMDKTPLCDDREMSTAERHGALKVLAVSAALVALATAVVIGAALVFA